MRNHLLKSIFISLILVLGINNAWSATTATLYYSVPASTVGCYTVKCFYNFGYSQTGLVEMTKVDKTSSGNLIYSVKLTANHDNVDNLLFQLFDGNTWKSEQQVMKDWTPLANNSGKMYVHNTGWKAYSTDASYTVYFVNKDSWTGTIKAYAWNSDCDKNKDWSGADMTSIGKTYKGKDIYSITLNKRYANIIFNNGSSKTADLTLGSTNIGKMYDGSNWVTYHVDPVVTFKANGGTGNDHTQTVHYNTSTALTANTFTRTGYTFAGWNTKTDGTGASYSDKQKVTLTANTTLYAKWTENTYTVTISAGTGGTVSPSGSQTIGQITQTTITATANDNYEFANWTATGGVIVANNSAASTTITATAAGTLTANFRSTATYSLTVAEGAGIASVEGSTDPVTLGSTYEIKATPKTGYTFNTWTANPAENATFGSATTANTNVTVKNGSVTVTASATENMSTLTTSNKYDAGDPGYAAPYATVSKIGIATEAKIIATTAGNGYTFTGWTLTNCTRTDGGAADATSITVRSNGDGKAATITANYTEVLTTGWYLAGEFSNKDDKDTGWSTNQIEFKKLSGESSGTVSYITLDLLPTTFTDEYNMSFKLVNGDWYGNDGEYKKANDKQDWQFETGKGNCNLDVSLPGTYTFCLNTNKDGKVYLNIAYPVVNQLQVYSADPAHPEAIANWEWDIKTGDKYSKTLTLNEETKYTFKAVVNSEFYGKSTTLKRSSSSAVLNTSDGDVTLATDIAGDYKFEFNASTKELSVDYPVSDYDYYISGSVNDWAKYDNGYGMTETSANTYEKTLTLQAGDHTFKVHQLAGDWYGWSDIDNTDFIELSNDGDNIKLTLTNTTDVTIKFDSNTKKISFEGLTAVTYTDITVQLYTEESAPQIWWWGSDGEQSKDAEDTYDYDTNAPTMNAVAGEDNWYEWTIKDVATHSGVIVRFKKSSTQSADYTVYENTCFDGRDLANTRTTTCGEVPTTCLDCSGIYLKGTFNEWLPDNEFKKTSDPNVVTLSINLTKGNHEFKIHGDEWYGNTGNLTRENTEQAWTYNKDEDKTPFRVDVAGDYKFSWNISEHKLTVTYPTFPDISKQPEKIYFLPNTSWKTADATFAAFFLDGDKGTAAKWVAFTDADGDGMYELTNDKKYLTVIFCRMNPNGTDTDNWKNKWNQSADITIPNASYLNCWIDDSDTWDDATGTWAMPLSSGDNSAAITAAADQTVTALVNRSFTKDDGWYTLALPFNMNAALIGEAYQLSGLVKKTSEDVEVNLENTSTISAGQPYLILPNENKSYLLVDNVTIVDTKGASIIKSISGLSVSMQAIINGGGTTNGSTEYYVGDNGLLYNGEVAKHGLRAFFTITDETGNPTPIRARVVAGENVETGVEDIITTDAPVKVIENGQLIIIRGGVKYNVQGQRL